RARRVRRRRRRGSGRLRASHALAAAAARACRDPPRRARARRARLRAHRARADRRHRTAGARPRAPAARRRGGDLAARRRRRARRSRGAHELLAGPRSHDRAGAGHGPLRGSPGVSLRVRRAAARRRAARRLVREHVPPHRTGLASRLTAPSGEPTLLLPMRFSAVLLLLTACAASPPPPAAAPPPDPGPAVDPEALRAPSRDPPVRPAAVPPPPDACARYVEPAECTPGPELAERLANALGIEDPLARDRELACAESQNTELAPLVRALRADLAPIAC